MKVFFYSYSFLNQRAQNPAAKTKNVGGTITNLALSNFLDISTSFSLPGTPLFLDDAILDHSQRIVLNSSVYFPL